MQRQASHAGARSHSVLNPLPEEGSSGDASTHDIRSEAASSLAANIKGLQKHIPPSMWWMRSVNQFKTAVFVEDEDTVRTGFWKTVMFASLMFISITAYVLITYLVSSQARPVIIQQVARPSLQQYLQLSSRSDSPPSCACSGTQDLLVNEVATWSPPSWGDLHRGTSGVTTALVGTAYATDLGFPEVVVPVPDGNDNTTIRCSALSPVLPFSEADVTAASQGTDASKCAAALLIHHWQVMLPIAERASVLPQRVLTVTLPRTILTPDGLNASVGRIVAEKVLTQTGDIVAHMQSTFQANAFFNLPGPAIRRSFRNIWDACAIPGTVSDSRTGQSNCSCENSSPFCSAEVWADPWHMYPAGQRPSWVRDRPVRMGCPNTDFWLDQYTPMYFMQAPALYGPSVLNCSSAPALPFPHFSKATIDAEPETVWLYRGGTSSMLAGVPTEYPSLAQIAYLPVSSVAKRVASRFVDVRPDVFTLNYTRYYELCAPATCSYTEEQAPASLFTVFIAGLSLVGGLQIFWRTCTDVTFDTVQSCCCKVKASASNTLSTFASYSERRRRRRFDASEVEEEAARGPVLIRSGRPSPPA